jgi:hypothetical protein
MLRALSFLKVKNQYLNQIPKLYHKITDDTKSAKLNLGQLQAALNRSLTSINSLHEVEFKVFSQWGDDGIIQYLVHVLDIPYRTFIEFGVEDYTESNTRFLLINNNYSGLVIDGDEKNISKIKQDAVFWLHDLYAEHKFITKDNICSVIQKFLNKGFDKEIGLLSIDIDGNDYWIWKNIINVNPIIVIAEYNAVFGSTNKWTVPYQKDFVMGGEFTRYYWGASLNALVQLGAEKGYSLVGCNSNGNNAYFVRNDHLKHLKVMTPQEAFVMAKYKMEYDENDDYSIQAKYKKLIGLPIFDLGLNKDIFINKTI